MKIGIQKAGGRHGRNISKKQFIPPIYISGAKFYILSLLNEKIFKMKDWIADKDFGDDGFSNGSPIREF